MLDSDRGQDWEMLNHIKQSLHWPAPCLVLIHTMSCCLTGTEL